MKKIEILASIPSKKYDYLISGYGEPRYNNDVSTRELCNNYLSAIYASSALNQIKKYHKFPEAFAAERIALMRKAVLIAQEIESKYTASLYYRLAELNAWLGNNDVAMEYCERALACKPNAHQLTVKNIEKLLSTLEGGNATKS